MCQPGSPRRPRADAAPGNGPPYTGALHVRSRRRLATGLASLGLYRFLGLGLGGAIPNAAALVSEFVPRRQRAFAVTLTIVCVPIGGTLAGLLAIRTLAMGWRTLFLIGGLVRSRRLMCPAGRWSGTGEVQWGG